MKNYLNTRARHGIDDTGASLADCHLIWQGDLGQNVPTGNGIFGAVGVNPCLLSPALPSGGTSNMKGGEGIPVRAFKLGDVVRGDYGTEFVYCRWVPGSTLDLLPGMLFQIDENFTAIQATIAAQVISAPFGVSMIFQPAVLAGTYFLWLAVRGNIGMRAAASSILGGIAETTATAGIPKFLVSHTSTSLTVNGIAASAASSNITFKADTLNGSPVLSNIASQISLEGVLGGITDLQLGATFTGTNAPSNACLASLYRTGPNSWGGTIGTATTGAQKTLQNASGTATGTTFTITTNVQAVALNPLGATAAT